MTTAAKPSAFIAVVTVCALLFQFGACAYSTKPQSIPVTSNPVGARIIADGQDAGTTPLTLSLKRNADHKIRIEKPGYNPVDILLVNKSSTANRVAHFGAGLILIPACALGGAMVGMLVSDENDYDRQLLRAGNFGLIGALAGTVLMFASAGSSSKAYLTPAVINVSLEKTQAQARTNVVILDRDQLKEIRWIRILCAEGGAAEVVAVN